MKILMISATFPYPPTKGGTHGRTFNLLQEVTKNNEITLITLKGEDVKEQEIEELKEYVKELKIFPCPNIETNSILGKITRFAQFLTKGTPPNVRYLYLKEIQDWIDEAVEKDEFDVITSEHSVNEIYIRPEWKGKVKTVLDIHSSVYRTVKNQLETNTSDNPFRDKLYLPLLRRYEKNTLQKFSQIVVTTDEDEQQMKDFAPTANINLIPNAVDLETFPYRNSDPCNHSLIFVGGLDYFVNIDGACFLAKEIFPKIQEKYPTATLTLVGSNPSQEVKALTKNPAITVTGRVPSVAEYLHKATIAVIPLRTGFGMKFKTLESMAAGIPVIASDRGLEGLQVESPLCALRANTIPEYIENISKLFEDVSLRQEISKNARLMIENQFTWKIAGKKYEQIFR
jgi:glycosyltransferase involved in cell wall biosynthesis